MRSFLLLVIFTLSLAHNAIAQNLLKHIPKDASFVMVVQGHEWLKLASIPYFENTRLGKEFMKELKRDLDDVQSLTDLGIDLDANTYCYLTSNDTISFMNIAIPVNNVAKFQKFIIEMSNYAQDDIPLNQISWLNDCFFQMNESVAFLHIPIFSANTFAAKYPNNKWGIHKISYADYYETEYAAADVAPLAVEELEDAAVATYDVYAPSVAIVDTVAMVADDDLNIAPPSIVNAYNTPVEPPLTEKAETVIVEPDLNAIEPGVVYHYVVSDTATLTVAATTDEYESDYYTYNNSAYDIAYKKQDSLKQILFQDMLNAKLLPYFNANHVLPTIQSNKWFNKAYDEKALVSVFVDGKANMFNYLYTLWGINDIMLPNDDYHYVSANMFMNSNEIKVNSEVKLTSTGRKKFKKLTDRKLNKDLLAYYDQNKVIGGFSFAYNTENYLHYVSKELKNYYYDYYVKKEDVGIISDLLALLIDEKAIGKAIKGDGLLLINDLKPMNVQYVSYEYDETDFQSIAVEKEKEETLPELLLMYSTDDATIHRKLLAYLNLKGKLNVKHGIYTVNDKYNDLKPFNWHVMVKDGIVFLSNSIETLEKINLGKYQKDISCKSKRMLRKNAMTAFFYPEKMHNKIKTGNINMDGKLNAMMLKLDEVKMQSAKVRCGKQKTTFVAKVPSSQENGLKYIINGMNALFYNISKY